MRTWSAMAKALMGVTAFAVVGMGWVAGCSSNDTSSGEPGVDAGLVCPVTIADVGKVCSVGGKVCPTLYSCGAFSQQAQCTCTKGHFDCNDSAGQPLMSPDQPPTCIPQGSGNDSKCPASEALADSKACTVSGLQCHYPGVTCSDGVQRRDTCMCASAVDGGPGLVFTCEPAVCNPQADASAADTSPPVDAAKPDTSTPPADAAGEGG